MRIALYSHDSYGLGHLRRCLHLAWSVERCDPSHELVLITGSPRARSFALPTGTEVVKLVSITKDERGHYVSRERNRPLDETVRARKRTLREALLQEPPDVLVVDHSPFGLQGELLPLLADLKKCGTRLVLGLRDIIDEAQRVRREWGAARVGEAIEKLYDDVVVYGDRSIFDLAEAYSLPEALAPRLRYLGYLGRDDSREPAPHLSASFVDPSRPHVLCTVGGGEDGLELMQLFLNVARREDRWNATLVTGPFVGTRLLRLLDGHSGPGLQILRFTEDMERLLRGSDLVVSMGGYNSVVEALSHRSRMLVVPRVFPRREQWVRAQAFAERGLLACLDPAGLSADQLADAMIERLQDDRPPHPSEIGVGWAGGPAFAARMVMSPDARARMASS